MADARGAPSPFDAYLGDYVATAELRAYPTAALAEFKRVFEAAASLSPRAPDASASSSDALYYAKYDLQLDAIYAFALQRRWPDGLALARRFDPGRGYSKADAYNPIITQMAEGRDFDRAPAVAEECYQADGSFPYPGARTLLASNKLSQADEIALARLGLRQASAAIAPSDSSARFLAAVAEVQPALNAAIEDAAIAMLDHLDSVRSKTAIGRRSSEETGGQILGILRRLDPSRAAEEALAHPSFGYVSPRPNLAIEATPGTTNFRFAPPGSGAAPDAQSSPVGALASAEALADKASRFRALAQLAQRNASLHPEVAAPAANDAYALLDKEIVAQNPLVAIHLADSLQRLGNARAASVVVSDCLAYAATAAALVGDQFAELEAGDQAEQWSSIKLASETLLLVYFAGARMKPAAAEAGARAIRYAPLRTMAEAASAAGEAGVPNLRSLLSLVGASS